MRKQAESSCELYECLWRRHVVDEKGDHVSSPKKLLEKVLTGRADAHD